MDEYLTRELLEDILTWRETKMDWRYVDILDVYAARAKTILKDTPTHTNKEDE